MPVKIFFCYSRKDEKVLDRLKRHLIPLQRQGLIDVWYDRDISAGGEWEPEIAKHLNEAHIILLLVSSNFMVSDYCYSIEMKRALERHERGEARVIPIILRSCDWQGAPFSKLQVLPSNAKPINTWVDTDKAFLDIAQNIRKVVEQLMASSPVTFSVKSVKPTKRKQANPVSAIKTEEFVLKSTFKGHSHSLLSVAISPDGQIIVSGHEDEIKVWNLHTEELLYNFTELGWVRSVAISSDGQIIVSGNSDGTIKLWNLHTRQLLHTLKGHSHSVLSVAISPDGQTIASGSENEIKVWNLHTEELLYNHTAYSRRVNSVAISPDGQTLVGGIGEISIIRVLNLHTGELQDLSGKGRRYRGLERGYSVESVAISPDGQIIVSGNSDGTIKLWNLHTGQLLHNFTELGWVRSVAISSNGETLVSGSWDRTIKVWNLHTRQLLQTLTMGYLGDVNSVAISPDGQTIASADGVKIRIWGKK